MSSRDNFDERLEAFKTGCEKIVFDFLNQPKDPVTGAPFTSSRFADEDNVSFTIKKTKMYAKIKGVEQDLGQSYTFAIVDLKTGDVFRPSSSLSGSLNRKKAICRGNIFDEYNGLRCVYADGPQEYVGDNKL